MIFPHIPTFASPLTLASFLDGSHPIVKGCVFFSQGQVSVAFFPTTTILLDGSGLSHKIIGAVLGDPSKFQILLVCEKALTSSAINIVKPDQVNHHLEISNNIATYLQGHPPPALDWFLKYAKDQDLALAQVTVVLPKVKGYPIIPGALALAKTFDSVIAMHPLVLEWATILLVDCRVLEDYFATQTDILLLYFLSKV